MTPRLHNYRIEFYGGPNDGEIVYQRALPIDRYDIASKEEGQVLVHNYQLTWRNDIQARYIYDGVTVIG